MLKSSIIESNPEYFLKDVAFNWHGTRLATCSQNTVQVWEMDSNKTWQKRSSFSLPKQDIVEKISWAHPQFGQVICTTTANTVSLWRYRIVDNGGLKWVSAKVIHEQRHLTIMDAKFAPPVSRSLELAYCTEDKGSTDGGLKIIKWAVTNDDNEWQYEVLFTVPSKRQHFTCLDWSTSCPTMIAVGSMSDPSGATKGQVQLFEYSEGTKQWSLNPITVCELQNKVHDVAFAPNPGRSFHTLAVASCDVMLITIKQNEVSGQLEATNREVLHDDNKVEVWQLSWSVLGTVLSSAGDDGLIKLWKNGKNGKWESVSEMRVKWDGTPTGMNV